MDHAEHYLEVDHRLSNKLYCPTYGRQEIISPPNQLAMSFWRLHGEADVFTMLGIHGRSEMNVPHATTRVASIVSLAARRVM